jgi:hypothetical protein
MSSQPKNDRRSGVDRRKVDKGPPNGIDRRKSIEPRKPEVQEVQISPSDWARLEESLVPPPAEPAQG